MSMYSCRACFSSWLNELPRLPHLPSSYSLYECRDCRLIQADVRERVDYSDYRYSVASGDVVDRHRDGIVEMIVQRTDRRKLLEIGCGDGQLLKKFEDAGFDVTGYEPSTSLCDKANAVLERGTVHNYALGQMLNGIFFVPTQHEGAYDVVIMQQVLDHMEYPVDAVSSLYLDAGGLLYVEVADMGMYQPPLELFNVEHYTYWDRTSLQAMLNRLGFVHEHSRGLYGSGLLQGVWTKQGALRAPELNSSLREYARLGEWILQKYSVIAGVGAGERTANAMQLMGIGPNVLKEVMDSNVELQGTELRNGVPVVGEFTCDPELVIVFCAGYAEDVRKGLPGMMALTVEELMEEAEV
jgi:SAM-dependent methyltransferase